MKVQVDINETVLRRLAYMIIAKPLSEIKGMSDEEVVLECCRVMITAAKEISIMKEEEGC